MKAGTHDLVISCFYYIDFLHISKNLTKKCPITNFLKDVQAGCYFYITVMIIMKSEILPF